jgi:hypothetical protein
MRIELRVEQNGKTIFKAECDTGRGGSFAEFSKSALKKFNEEHPEVSLLDDDVRLKFAVVRQECVGTLRSTGPWLVAKSPPRSAQ